MSRRKLADFTGDSTYLATPPMLIMTWGASEKSEGNEKFRAIMANLYGTKPAETECLGYMQPNSPKKLYKW